MPLPVRKKETKRLKGFRIVHFYGSFSNDILAVKGLITLMIFGGLPTALCFLVSECVHWVCVNI